MAALRHSPIPLWLVDNASKYSDGRVRCILRANRKMDGGSSGFKIGWGAEFHRNINPVILNVFIVWFDNSIDHFAFFRSLPSRDSTLSRFFQRAQPLPVYFESSGISLIDSNSFDFKASFKETSLRFASE